MMGEGVLMGEDAVMVMGPGDDYRWHQEQKGRAMMETLGRGAAGSRDVQ